MRALTVTMKRARVFRRELTLPEVLLWQDLRKKRVDGLRFRRQHAVGAYVLDFYAPVHRLAVEVDGASHDSGDRAAHDARRDRWLFEQGIRVLRFPATDVLSDERRADVLATVAAAAAPSTAFGGPPPPLRGGGSSARTNDARTP